MPKYVFSSLAENDLRHIWRFIARDNATAATRVVEAAYKTFDMLAGSPRIGKQFDVVSLAGEEIRFMAVAGFKKYVIFYRPISGGVEVLRVYHAARNLEELFSPYA